MSSLLRPTKERLDAVEERVADVRHELACIVTLFEELTDIPISGRPRPTPPEAAPHANCGDAPALRRNMLPAELPAAPVRPVAAEPDPRQQPGVAFLLPPPEDTSCLCPWEVADFLSRAWSLEGRADRCRRPKGALTLKLPFLQVPTLDREILAFGVGRSIPIDQARDKRLQQLQNSMLEILEPLASLLSGAVEHPPTKAAVAAAVARATAITARTNGLLLKERREGALAAFPDSIRATIPDLPEPSGDDASNLFGRHFLTALQANAAWLSAMDSAVDAWKKRPATKDAQVQKRPRVRLRQFLSARQPFPAPLPQFAANQGSGYGRRGGASRSRAQMRGHARPYP
ncbi:uncharacterized protein LOC135394283 [Ornithodoros turicata]|uniref:uncharacterized protein LOC135394283 n=1 Tax=Ornithodoros turicata TaxID=34597 RepID=UPI00313A1C0A